MITIRRPRLTRMKVSERVPSTFGSAFKEGSEMTVKSGSKFISSSAFGLMNRLRANRLCQAYSVTTRTRSRWRWSAHAKTSCVNTSWLAQNSSIRSSRPSNLAGAVPRVAHHPHAQPVAVVGAREDVLREHLVVGAELVHPLQQAVEPGGCDPLVGLPPDGALAGRLLDEELVLRRAAPVLAGFCGQR